MGKHLTGGQSEKELAPLIGERVSVRLYEDGGGYRDILGKLESFHTIRKKDGSTVEFNPAKISALRVVLDAEFRAGTGAPLSLRILDLEIAAAKTWPSGSLEVFGKWQIRISNGFSFRANSVLPTGMAPYGEPPFEISKSVNYVISKYDEKKLDPIFHISLPIHQELDDYLSQNGWESLYEILVMVGDTRELSLKAPTGEVIESRRLTESWLDLQGDRSVNEILEGYPSKFIELKIDRKTVAVGRLSIAEGWGILTRIYVAENLRRSGFGIEIVSALARSAEAAGCNKLALQVNSDNLVAINLYKKLGFETHHTYRYRRLVKTKRAADCC